MVVKCRVTSVAENVAMICVYTLYWCFYTMIYIILCDILHVTFVVGDASRLLCGHSSQLSYSSSSSSSPSPSSSSLTSSLTSFSLFSSLSSLDFKWQTCAHLLFVWSLVSSLCARHTYFSPWPDPHFDHNGSLMSLLLEWSLIVSNYLPSSYNIKFS